MTRNGTLAMISFCALELVATVVGYQTCASNVCKAINNSDNQHIQNNC